MNIIVIFRVGQHKSSLSGDVAASTSVRHAGLSQKLQAENIDEK